MKITIYRRYIRSVEHYYTAMKLAYPLCPISSKPVLKSSSYYEFVNMWKWDYSYYLFMVQYKFIGFLKNITYIFFIYPYDSTYVVHSSYVLLRLNQCITFGNT